MEDFGTDGRVIEYVELDAEDFPKSEYCTASRTLFWDIPDDSEEMEL